MIIEKKLIKFLNDRLSVPAYAEREANPPDKYVIIERVGMTESNFVTVGTFTFRSVAPTLIEAAELDAEVHKVMRDFAEIDNVFSVSLNASTNYTNPTTEEYRYQSTYLINYQEDN